MTTWHVLRKKQKPDFLKAFGSSIIVRPRSPEVWNTDIIKSVKAVGGTVIPRPVWDDEKRKLEITLTGSCYGVAFYYVDSDDDPQELIFDITKKGKYYVDLPTKLFERAIYRKKEDGVWKYGFYAKKTKSDKPGTVDRYFDLMVSESYFDATGDKPGDAAVYALPLFSWPDEGHREIKELHTACVDSRGWRFGVEIHETEMCKDEPLEILFFGAEMPKRGESGRDPILSLDLDGYRCADNGDPYDYTLWVRLVVRFPDGSIDYSVPYQMPRFCVPSTITVSQLEASVEMKPFTGMPWDPTGFDDANMWVHSRYSSLAQSHKYFMLTERGAGGFTVQAKYSGAWGVFAYYASSVCTMYEPMKYKLYYYEVGRMRTPRIMNYRGETSIDFKLENGAAYAYQLFTSSMSVKVLASGKFSAWSSPPPMQSFQTLPKIGYTCTDTQPASIDHSWRGPAGLQYSYPYESLDEDSLKVYEEMSDSNLDLLIKHEKSAELDVEIVTPRWFCPSDIRIFLDGKEQPLKQAPERPSEMRPDMWRDFKTRVVQCERWTRDTGDIEDLSSPEWTYVEGYDE